MGIDGILPGRGRQDRGALGLSPTSSTLLTQIGAIPSPGGAAAPTPQHWRHRRGHRAAEPHDPACSRRTSGSSATRLTRMAFNRHDLELARRHTSPPTTSITRWAWTVSRASISDRAPRSRTRVLRRLSRMSRNTTEEIVAEARPVGHAMAAGRGRIRGSSSGIPPPARRSDVTGHTTSCRIADRPRLASPSSVTGRWDAGPDAPGDAARAHGGALTDQPH